MVIRVIVIMVIIVVMVVAMVTAMIGAIIVIPLKMAMFHTTREQKPR